MQRFGPQTFYAPKPLLFLVRNQSLHVAECQARDNFIFFRREVCNTNVLLILLLIIKWQGLLLISLGWDYNPMGRVLNNPKPKKKQPGCLLFILWVKSCGLVEPNSKTGWREVIWRKVSSPPLWTKHRQLYSLLLNNVYLLFSAALARRALFFLNSSSGDTLCCMICGTSLSFFSNVQKGHKRQAYLIGKYRL